MSIATDTSARRTESGSARVIPQALSDLALRLRDNLREKTPQMGEQCSAVPAEHYCSQERCSQEMSTVFRNYPVIVGHRDQVAQPGDVIRHDALGLPLLITRDKAGALHCFLNACRHRSMRLQDAPRACGKRSLVCPYHGWTYELDGRLKHVPHDYAFPGLDKQSSGLVELPCAQHHGLIWVLPTPGAAMDVSAYLGAIGADFGYLALDDAVLYQHTESRHAANWKLVIDAFLEAYHVRVLHRNSIYPFFEDAMAANDVVAPHLRSAVARKGLAETDVLPGDTLALRNLVTYTHFIFPNTIIIFNPDYASVLSFFPDGPEHLNWSHYMLIPGDQNNPACQAHWQKTLELIKETVFEREDLFAAEGMQVGLRSGANKSMTLGRLEHMIRYFHDRIQDAIDGDGPVQGVE